MRIGLICCFYNCADDIDKVMAPWLEIHNDETNDIQFEFAAAHAQFSHAHELGIPDNDYDTQDKLKTMHIWDHLYIQNDYEPVDTQLPLVEEYEPDEKVRNHLLNSLLSNARKPLDYVWILDGDEFYTVSDILNIVKFIRNKPLVAWFKISFKNYIFDGKQWLDGFCPPRIFSVNYNQCHLESFYWENDVRYVKLERSDNPSVKYVKYEELPFLIIPKAKAHIVHKTWLHINGKQKYEYQMKRYGHCSYKWNDTTQRLEIDYDYYAKHGLAYPIIYHD